MAEWSIGDLERLCDVWVVGQPAYQTAKAAVDAAALAVQAAENHPAPDPNDFLNQVRRTRQELHDAKTELENVRVGLGNAFSRRIG